MNLKIIQKYQVAQWPVLNSVKTNLKHALTLKWNYQLSSNKREPREFNLNMQMVFVFEIKNYESVKIVRMASLNNISLDTTPGGENLGEVRHEEQGLIYTPRLKHD